LAAAWLLLAGRSARAAEAIEADICIDGTSIQRVDQPKLRERLLTDRQVPSPAGR
jgi:hypothetical protein